MTLDKTRTKITVVARPYLIHFRATNTTYPATSEEVQRLLDEYPVIAATSHKVVLGGHNTDDYRQRVELRTATLGGGPGFVIERGR